MPATPVRTTTGTARADVERKEREGWAARPTSPEPTTGGEPRISRRRVLEGLGRERGGRLSPAIERYAEGLLQ
jgi:hypothetical protein